MIVITLLLTLFVTLVGLCFMYSGLKEKCCSKFYEGMALLLIAITFLLLYSNNF